MAHSLISPSLSLRKSLPSFNAMLTGLIVILLTWAFFAKHTYRFYASILFSFYHLTQSMWISVVLLGVFQTILLIPFRIINLTKSKHIRDFEAKINQTKLATEQSFLIKESARKGNRVFLYYVVDFFVQLTSFLSIGRLFLTDFYATRIDPDLLYDFVAYPAYPLKDTWFKIPYIRIYQTTDMGLAWVIFSWILILVASLLIVSLVRAIKKRPNYNAADTPDTLRNIVRIFTGSSLLLMIFSYFIIRNAPTHWGPAIFTGDISLPNRTFNSITALATFFTILWLDLPTIIKKADLAKKAGIASSIIRQTQMQLFKETLRSATIVGLGAYFITNLIPSAFELSICTLEIISWLSPLTLDRLILGSNPRTANESTQAP